MAEYINQDDTIEALDRVCKACDNENCYRHKGREYCPVMAVIDDIKDLPIADVQPVKRGRWKYYKNRGIWDIHKCTVCDTPFELPMEVVPSSVFCYCPHCGAKMSTE